MPDGSTEAVDGHAPALGDADRPRGHSRRTVLKATLLGVVLGADVIALSYDPPSTYPYPVLAFSRLARSGDSLYSACSRLTAPTIVDLEGVPLTFEDFAVASWDHSPSDNGGWGFYVPNVAGFLNANLSMTPGSSTKGPLVNALVAGDVNSYDLVRLSAGNRTGVPAYFTGTITGTDQGHLYHGLQFYETDRAVLGPAKIIGIPGAAGGLPPWETFAFGTYHSTNITMRDVEIDGLGRASGGIGSGSVDRAGFYRYTRVNVHDIGHGSAITHYRLTNTRIEFDDSTTVRTAYAGLNFEQCGGSTIAIRRHTFGDSPVDIVLDSNNGPAHVTIDDPRFVDGRTRVRICVHDRYVYPYRPNGPVNSQLDGPTNNHVTLRVDGSLRPDLIEFVSSYTPTG